MAVLFLMSTTAVFAQWEYDYPISLQVEQKPISNSLFENAQNSDLIGVVNEKNGRGFWIYEVDLNGQMISSHYYVHPDNDITIRVYAIDHSGAENIVAGEIDRGGTKNLFLMRCNANGNGTVGGAIELPSANGLSYHTVCNDILQTGFSGNLEFLAICSERFPGTQAPFPNPVRPYVVKFDKFLNILDVWHYPVVHSQSPTEARLVNSNSEVLIVGESGYTYNIGSSLFPNHGIFKMRINPNTGAVITTDGTNTASHILYRQSTTFHSFSPTILSNSGSDYIAFALQNPSSDNRLTVAKIDNSITTSGFVINLQYKHIDDDELVPVQMSLNSSGYLNVLYNRTKNGVTEPAWASINSITPYNVPQDVKFLDPTGGSEAVSAFIRSTSPNDVHFSSVNTLNELGVGYTSTSAFPSCNKPVSMYKSNSPHWFSWADDLTNAVTTFPQPEQLDMSLADPNGLMRDCNGNVLSSFKKAPLSLGEREADDLEIQHVGDARYRISSSNFDEMELRITTASGQELLYTERTEPTTVIDLSAYPKGMYFITSRSGDNMKTAKVYR